MSEPRHKSFGTPLSEWIERIPNELPIDAVGLWQIVPTFTDAFDLTGEPLERAVRLAIRGLLRANAVPVQGRAGSSDWFLREDLVADDEEAGVELIINHWKNLGHKPDLGDIWFALKQDVA